MKIRNVLITGGSNGIGYESARSLNRTGYKVFSLDMHPPETPIEGVEYIQGDVTKHDSISSAISSVNAIDILFNNAGVRIGNRNLVDTPPEDAEKMFQVNVLGAYNMVRCARDYMTGNPTIIQMSSALALDPTETSFYAFTKKITFEYAESLARQNPNFNVKTVFPGPVDTRLFRNGKTEEAISRIKPHPPSYVADWVVKLVESDKTKLIFDNTLWDYRLE